MKITQMIDKVITVAVENTPYTLLVLIDSRCIRVQNEYFIIYPSIDVFKEVGHTIDTMDERVSTIYFGDDGGSAA